MAELKIGDRLTLPRQYALDEQVAGNPIRQLLHLARTAKVAARFASPASLHGRDRLRQALTRLGLALK